MEDLAEYVRFMALSNNQLGSLHEANQVRIRTRSDRGTFKTIIWIVVVDGVVYVRSVRGEGGRWYQRALADQQVGILLDGDEIEFRAVHVDDPAEIEAVSDALRDKYPPGGSLDAMIQDEVLGTTMRLDPL
jgi:hypothetical protein